MKSPSAVPTPRHSAAARLALALVFLLATCIHSGEHRHPGGPHTDADCLACTIAHGSHPAAGVPVMLPAEERCEVLLPEVQDVGSAPCLNLPSPRGPPAA
jgi:hypothetical protein